MRHPWEDDWRTGADVIRAASAAYTGMIKAAIGEGERPVRQPKVDCKPPWYARVAPFMWKHHHYEYSDCYWDLRGSWFALGLVTAIVAVICCCVCGGSGIDYASVQYDCGQLRMNTGHETKFNHSLFSPTCYIKINGEWMPVDKWQEVKVHSD